MTNSKHYKYKEIHKWTHHHKNAESQGQGENLKRNKRKRTHYLQGNPSKVNSRTSQQKQQRSKESGMTRSKCSKDNLSTKNFRSSQAIIQNFI